MKDRGSLVVLLGTGFVLLCLLFLFPLTTSRVLVAGGILAGLCIASVLRSVDGVRLAILSCFLVVLLLPLLLRTGNVQVTRDAQRQLVIITPHNEQIRTEFGDAFERWHLETWGEPVEVAWNVPGGTSEIRRMLQAQYTASLKEGQSPGGDADLVFGGGSYEHNELKKGVHIEVDGVQQHSPITIPAELDESMLLDVYGQTSLAGVHLWDPEQYWYGTALSAFGLVYNREVLEKLGVPEPESWDAVADPRLRSWVALVNPNQSGSITTAFETILERRGWTPGWQVLRRAAANARDISASSLKAPTDVSQGDAAIGVCIDFFGRYQSQAIQDHGGGDRIGYIDPPGDTKVDPDPISMLAGAPDPELARRFILFVLDTHGQSLWQFQPHEVLGEDGLGPRQFSLRRLPVRREMYTRYADRMMDRIDPYAVARPPEHPDRAMRAFIAPLFAAMAMDTNVQLKEAWDAIVSHPGYPDEWGVVTSDMVEDEDLRAMLEAFDAMPLVKAPDRSTLMSLETPEGRSMVKAGWLRGGWQGKGLWPPDAEPERVLRQRFVDFFMEQYESVLRISVKGSSGG
jgi:iron(III) transport system substrate-binding protein